MGVLTIAGVNAGTDQLNIVAHGLNTGDGFLAIYTPDPAGVGAIPGGLAPVTNYWAIRIDADHIKLADSSAHAMAGTAINITDAGSGTLQLLQGLPYRVPGIAAMLTQVKSANDNATWLSLVALWNLLTGQAQAVWTAVKIAVPVVFKRANEILPFGIESNDCIIVSGGAVTRTAGTGGCVVDGGATAYFKLPPVPQHTRLNQLTVWIACDLLAAPGGGGPGPTFTLKKYDEGGTATAVVVAVEAGAVVVVLTPPAPAANVATVYELEVQAVGGHAVTIKKAEYLWDIPVT